MKVGFIFECGPDGADRVVCEHLARRLQPNIEILSEPLRNKPRLISRCGFSSANLLKQGCERVFIFWDLYPSWTEAKPCRKQDREAVLHSLEEARVDTRKVHLICIEEELEDWLLADGRAISQVLSTQAHPVKISDKKKPGQRRNPKTQLNQIFQQYRGNRFRYNDLFHAEEIVKALPDLTKITRYCETFERFTKKLTSE